jgi:uncharacterized membrane protein YvbJ
MKCVICGFDNEAREAYCRACGSKMQITLDQVEGDLVAKADQQMEQKTEEEIRRYLVVAICLFLISLTAKVLYGPATWPSAYLVPSAAQSADYATYTWQIDVPLQPGVSAIPPPK